MLRAICRSVGWHAVGSLKSKGGGRDILSAFEAQLKKKKRKENKSKSFREENSM